MSENCNLIVQKANKDNSVVLVEKDVCIKQAYWKDCRWCNEVCKS